MCPNFKITNFNQKACEVIKRLKTDYGNDCLDLNLVSQITSQVILGTSSSSLFSQLFVKWCY